MANVIPTVARAETYAKIEDNIIEDVMSLRPKPLNDVVLIVGDAKGVWDDLKRFYKLQVPHDTMCINHMGMAFSKMNLKFEHFLAGDAHRKQEQKIAQSLNGTLKHCWNPGCGEENGYDVRWVKQDRRGWSGTTATLGVKIAIALDYVRIVLAGIPMDKSGHWYDKWLDVDDVKRQSKHTAHLHYWVEMATRPLGQFIRSMSGNTKDLFGKPTKRWLTEVIGNG
jgi:hypothetical protein